MRKLLAAATAAVATLAVVAPAFADVSSTIRNVIAKGVMMDVMGMQIDMTYNEDGTFVGAGGQFAGRYRIDGDKICISADVIPQELCQVYPADKGPGDSFELTSDFGAMTVTINR